MFPGTLTRPQNKTNPAYALGRAADLQRWPIGEDAMKLNALAAMIFMLSLSGVTGSHAAAVTYYVATNGSDSASGESWAEAKATIQAAVDICPTGGVVLVGEGTYSSPARYYGGTSNRVVVLKPIEVRSHRGASSTAIVGSGPIGDAAVRCLYISTNASIIGFTLRNGYTRDEGYWDPESIGGGVWCDRALVQDCIVVSNTSASVGGGVAVYNGGVVRGSAILGNDAGSMHGGGAYLVDSTLDRCFVIGNRAYSGGGVEAQDASLVRNCLVVSNTATGYRGGGLMLDDTSLAQNCTVVSNSAKRAGGGVYCVDGGTVENCIVYHNTAESSPNWFNYDATGIAYVHCCTIPLEGIPDGTGCLSNAPALFAATDGAFRLTANSPCLDAGTNRAWMLTATDYDGQPRLFNAVVDVGADEATVRCVGIATSGTIVETQWDCVPGMVYRLDSCADLRAPSWTPVSGIATATQATTTLQDDLQQPEAFYQLNWIKDE